MAATPPMQSVAPETERRFRPVSFVLDQMSKRGAPYSAAERWIVLMIVRRMRLDPASGEFVAWPSMADVARRSGSSVATVKRLVQQHCDGPAPLLKRAFAATTCGHQHRSYRFTLVSDPEAFASARDRARVARSSERSRRAKPKSLSIVLRGQRLIIFAWMIDDLRRMVGPQTFAEWFPTSEDVETWLRQVDESVAHGEWIVQRGRATYQFLENLVLNRAKQAGLKVW